MNPSASQRQYITEFRYEWYCQRCHLKYTLVIGEDIKLTSHDLCETIQAETQ